MLIPSIAGAGNFLKDTLGQLAGAAVSGAAQGVHDKSGDISDDRSKQLAGALGEVAERVASNEQVKKAVDSVGKIASQPTKNALAPHIIVATVAAVVAIAVIVHLAKKS